MVKKESKNKSMNLLEETTRKGNLEMMVVVVVVEEEEVERNLRRNDCLKKRMMMMTNSFQLQLQQMMSKSLQRVSWEAGQTCWQIRHPLLLHPDCKSRDETIVLDLQNLQANKRPVNGVDSKAEKRKKWVMIVKAQDCSRNGF